MTTKEIKKQVKSINKLTKKVSASKKAAQKFLVEAGIYTEKGNLKKNYR